MNFKEKLYNILEDVNNFEDRNILFANCVNDRLDTSLHNYIEKLNLLCTKILQRDSYRTLKASSAIIEGENKND